MRSPVDDFRPVSFPRDEHGYSVLAKTSFCLPRAVWGLCFGRLLGTDDAGPGVMVLVGSWGPG